MATINTIEIRGYYIHAHQWRKDMPQSELDALEKPLVTCLECQGCRALFLPEHALFIHWRGCPDPYGHTHTPSHHEYNDETDRIHQDIRSWMETHQKCPDYPQDSYSTKEGVLVKDRRRIRS